VSDTVRATAPKRVVKGPAAKSCSCGGSGPDCDCDKRHQPLQRSASGPGPASVPASVTGTVAAPGRPLDAGARATMESRFGRDFGGVRIHTDHQAAESARAVNARAYTVGQHIAFAGGQYQPHTPTGQHLLAHELAHTVQQRGLQRKPSEVGILDPGVSTRYEREADHAANAVAGAPPITARPPVPVICRAPATPAADQPKTENAEPARVWEPVPATNPLSALGVKAQSKLRPGEISPVIRAFKLGTLALPPEKGPVLTYWQTRAKAGGLESFIDADGRPRAALKQERAGTDELKRIWMTRVGFASSKDAAAAWATAGGDASTSFEPKVAGKTCQMDHIIELQIGGNNVPENIQCLDAAENQKSGRDLFAKLKRTAQQIRDLSPGLETVILHFDDVIQTSAIRTPCYEVEQRVIAAAGQPAADAGEDSEPYDIVAAVPTTLSIDKGVRTPRKVLILPIAESKYLRTRAASTLIPGMVLRELELKSKGNDEIEAGIDTSEKTRLPITIEKETRPIRLIVNEATRAVKLKSTKVNLAFTYPYLSKGAITDLNLDPQEGLSGEGWLRSDLPFLKGIKLVVRFGPDRFELVTKLDAKKLKLPFGARVTRADLGLLLHPEFKPTGEVEFEVGRGRRKVLDGRMAFESDADGLVAVGAVRAWLPGVDAAEGTIEYRAGQWTGQVTIAASQIGIPALKDASVTVIVAGGDGRPTLTASGYVLLGLPGDNEVRLEVIRREGGWAYRGKGRLVVPGVKPVDFAFYYVGDKLRGTASTEIEVKDFKGKLALEYDDGRLSGEGTISGRKGRANLEQAKVRYNGRTGKFSGEGTLSYQVSENLIATAGVEIPEKGPVKLKGALTFPKPILLFKPFGDDFTIFRLPDIDIPIPGASIGPVGLEVRIRGRLDAAYSIGPGQLQNTRIGADFQPFEENKDLKVDLVSLLVIPASATLTADFSARVAIDVFVAEVEGSIGVKGSATLAGGLSVGFTAHYEKDRFTAEATPQIDAALILGLRLYAQLRAEAGVGPFSVETTKTWEIDRFTYDPGIKVGLKAPIRYDSAASPSFQPPSLDQIQWVRPTIEPRDLLSKGMAGKGTEVES
jgi:Domain of unknown function (DUF4157)